MASRQNLFSLNTIFLLQALSALTLKVTLPSKESRILIFHHKFSQVQSFGCLLPSLDEVAVS